ncbi:MAG: hypothetical protein ACK5KV_12995 [Bacteroides graminisolvens]|jgi:hypothetical protein|uniref:hypothetical protein n=1 Tax=Bacteroides graminisolvens TaxID=477666 RepID=UPI003A898273
MIKYLLALFILCCSCKGAAQIVKEKDPPDDLLKIDEINEVKSFYIIYAQRNDSIFKIVSKKRDKPNNLHKKIKVGESYLLNLRVIFPLDSILGFKVMNPLDVSNIVLEDGFTVRIEESSHYKIYESDNLKGLYYEEK